MLPIYLARLCPLNSRAGLIEVGGHVRELALLQLGLPEDGVHVAESVLHPSIFLDMVQVDGSTRVCVTMHGCEDAAATELESFFVCEVVFVFSVEDTVGEGLTGANAEEVSRETGTVAVYVVESGSFFLGYASAHGSLVQISLVEYLNLSKKATYHAETHALIGVDEVGENLGCGGDGDAALVPELV